MALLSLTDLNGNPYYVNTDNVIGFGSSGFLVLPDSVIQVEQSASDIAGMWPSGGTLLTLTDLNGDAYYVNSGNVIGFGTDYNTLSGTMFEVATGGIEVTESPATVESAWPS